MAGSPLFAGLATPGMPLRPATVLEMHRRTTSIALSARHLSHSQIFQPTVGGQAASNSKVGAAHAPMPPTQIGGYATVSTTTQSSEKVVRDVPLQIELRDWFAGQALAGMMANESTPFSADYAEVEPSQIASAVYDLADALLAERQKGGDA